MAHGAADTSRISTIYIRYMYSVHIQTCNRRARGMIKFVVRLSHDPIVCRAVSLCIAQSIVPYRINYQQIFLSGQIW